MNTKTHAIRIEPGIPDDLDERLRLAAGLLVDSFLALDSIKDDA